MSLDVDTTDTRTRRFTNAGNSCYINATLQALFAVPPVQRLYGEAGLNRHLSGGCKRDDGQIDGDLSIAITYREARSASKKLQPMFPQMFLDNFYDGNQDDASIFFQQFSNSHRCVAPRLVDLLEGRDRPLGKCGTCAQSRTLAGSENFTTLSIPMQTGGHLFYAVQDAVDHYFRWEDVDFGIDCSHCPRRAVSSQRRHRLESYPQVLCSVLMRWIEHENAVSGHNVHMTRQLSIGGKRYNLCSGVVQRGNAHDGHYWSICRHTVNQEDTWWCTTMLQN